MGNPFYREYADLLMQKFGCKVQKLSVNTGTACPNRDGTLGRGGCIYCNNAAFVPGYALTPATTPAGVAAQIAEGRRFFARKYPQMRYLPYFQGYTATHAGARRLIPLLEAACAQPGVAGLVIGTRPDCMPGALLQYLSDRNRTMPVLVEYGAETSHDATLKTINRCHTWQCTADAVSRTAGAGISVGLHLIMGLPGEDTPMMMQTIERVNALPVQSIKLHQLQTVKDTPLHRMWQTDPAFANPMTLEAYIDLCTLVVKHLRRDIAIDRFVSQAPPGMVAAPQWGVKNHVFTAMLQQRLSSQTGQ